MFRAFHKFNPFSPIETVFPKAQVFEELKQKNTLGRVWGYGYAHIDSNFETYEKLYSAQGYDPLYNKRYGEFLYSSKDGKLLDSFDRTNRADALISQASSGKELIENTYRLKVLDLLSTKYVLDRMENKSNIDLLAPDRFKLIYSKDGWLIFENLKAAPRAFLTSSYKTFYRKESFEKQFFSSSVSPLNTVFLEKNIGDLNQINSKENIKIITINPNKKQMNIKTSGEVLLFLSDSYFPGWKAYINGVETEVFRANYTFQAIKVPSGNHLVEFVYKPDSFKIGLIISFLSILVLILFLFKQKTIINSLTYRYN